MSHFICFFLKSATKVNNLFVTDKFFVTFLHDSLTFYHFFHFLFAI